VPCAMFTNATIMNFAFEMHNLMQKVYYCFASLFFFLFSFDMSTQEEGKGGFELMTSASLGVIHNRLSYPLETTILLLYFR
jgi:hypothetical protein